MNPAELTVLVFIAWPLASPERQALVEACTRAFSQGSCAEALDERESRLPAAWVDESSADEVDITVRTGEGSQHQRQLSFAPVDTSLERARAVGFTLGVLLGEVVQPEPLDEPLQVPPVAPPPPAPRWLLQAQLGAGWDTGLQVLEIGGALRGGWRPLEGPWWLGLGFDTWAPRGLERLRVHKSHGVLWSGVTWNFGELELGAALEVGMQWLYAQTSAPLESDRGTRWIPVVRASGSAVRWFGDHWGVALTAQGSWATSTTELFVLDEAIVSTGRSQFTLLVGPALRL